MTTLFNGGCAKPPSYAQVLAEKYGLSQRPSTSSEGFSDYHESSDQQEDEEMNFQYDFENNNEILRDANMIDTNEAIFIQRCIK